MKKEREQRDDFWESHRRFHPFIHWWVDGKEVSQAEFQELSRPTLLKSLEELAEEEDDDDGFYNRPFADAAPEFRFWTRTAVWSLEEAIALALGKRPSIVGFEQMRAEDRQFAFVQKFAVLQELVRRAHQAGDLSDPVRPLEFVSWIERNEINCFPVELKNLLEKRAKRASQNTGRPISTRERETLLKLLGGLAITCYRHDFQSSRTRTAAEVRDLAEVGVAVDPDTVRKYLKEAAELLPPQDSTDA
jgi:hypothetical protein